MLRASMLKVGLYVAGNNTPWRYVGRSFDARLKTRLIQQLSIEISKIDIRSTTFDRLGYIGSTIQLSKWVQIKFFWQYTIQIPD